MSFIHSGAAKFRHPVFDSSASPYKEDYQSVYHTDTKVYKLGCFVLFYLFFNEHNCNPIGKKMVTGVQVGTVFQVQVIGCRWQAISSCP